LRRQQRCQKAVVRIVDPLRVRAPPVIDHGIVRVERRVT